jgi:hypothetical protein
MPVILALRKLRQENSEFEGYTARPCLKKQNKTKTPKTHDINIK